MTQTKFEELFPGPDIPDDRDGSDQVMDPCKGPNPPAYCFIGEKADETQEMHNKKSCRTNTTYRWINV